MTVRTTAAQVLVRLEAEDRTLSGEIEHVRGDVPSRDDGLLIELVSGTLRWRNALDAVIASASQRAVRDLDPEARAVLRLAVYQLRYLDRIPPRAAVHEAVESIKALGRPRLAGFVNAVLRTVIRRGKAISLPKRPDTGASVEAQLRYLSITLSHPASVIWSTVSGTARPELLINRSTDFQRSTTSVTSDSI